MSDVDEFPITLSDLEERFATEEACLAYLYRLRWPEGFACPRCEGDKVWMSKRGLLVCSNCEYQVSIKAGTIFQGTRSPFVMWFRAAWWVTGQKNGASALGLQRILGLGSYETAWTWLHKFRRAMVRPGRDRLAGRVEVDETYLGGPEEGVYGRGAQKKALIVVAAQEDGKGIGRIRMRRVKDASADSLHAFICDSVRPGSAVQTDGWRGYAGLEEKGYKHETTKVSRRKEAASDLLPRVHRVVSLLKRWLMGTHQGAVSHEHLDYYLDEYAFRFNRRTSRHRGKLFYRLLQQAVQTEPAPYESMVKHVRCQKRTKHNM